MRATVIVFARQPRLGTLKKRLARDIGAPAALRFYRRALDRLERRLSGDRRWRLIWALTPDRAARRGGWRRAGSAVPQGRGDLGQRMARALRGAPPGPALVVGTDIPGIDRAAIAQAVRLLGRHDAVFGPSGDGGYWLVGLGGRRPLPYGFLGSVRWSTEHALKDSLASLPNGYRAAFASILDDVDTGEDYRRWRRSDRAAG